MRPKNHSLQTGGLPLWRTAAALWLAACLAAHAQTPAAPTDGQGVPLAAINQALAALAPQSGRFRQAVANGTAVSGSYHMDWPQRLRFAYDAGGPVITVKGKFIAIQDAPRQEPNWIPVSLTPLALIRRAVAQGISSAMLVTAQRGAAAGAGAYWALTLRDPAAAIDGEATLFFTDKDYRLYAWRLVDTQNLITQISLSRITYHSQLAARVFDVDYDEPEED